MVHKWWTKKPGKITRHTKSTVTIRWDDGVVTKCDKAHLRFLIVTRAGV